MEVSAAPSVAASAETLPPPGAGDEDAISSRKSFTEREVSISNPTGLCRIDQHGMYILNLILYDFFLCVERLKLI